MNFYLLQIYKVNNSELKAQFERKKQLIEMEIGDESEVWEAFHGSPRAEEIAYNGFDINYSHRANRFGHGVYFAPESSKANSYAYGVNKGCPIHQSKGCTSCPRTMLICSVIMGRIYSPQSLHTSIPSSYHSIHAKPEKVHGLNYDEIAVLDEEQVIIW